MKKIQKIENQVIVILLLIVFSVNALQSQTIPTPTQTDVIILDNGTPGKADPGDKIRYKVTIQNTHPSTPATGVQLNVVPDPRTTFVPGTFLSSPLAIPDPYTCTGNVPIFVAAPGIKANDFDDAPGSLSISSATNQATLRGGSVDIFADGSFEYTPPAGYEGDDSFTYTLNDATQAGPGAPITDVGTVTITISGMIWFINNSAVAGDGRLSSPFNSLGAFNTANGGMTMNNGDVVNPEINETIFLYTGGGNYTGGITLLNGQRLFGQGASTANLGTLTGITFNPNSLTLPTAGGTDPVITNAAGDGIQLGSGNTVRGLNIGVCSDFGIDDNGTVGTLTISEVDINTTGGGFRTDNGGTLAVTLGSVIAGGTRGIHLAGTGGSFSVSGATTTSSTVNQGIWIDNTSTNVSFAAITISSTGSGSNAFELSGNTGTFNASGTTTINAPVAGGSVSLLISGGSGTTTFAAIDINGRRDIGISIQSATNVTTGTVDMDNSNSVSGIVAFLISGQTGGSLNFGTTTINNNGAGSGIAVAIGNSNATITFASGSSITGTTTTGFSVNQGSGSITYNGAITNTAGSAVSVTSRTGGTVAFTGNINSSGGGTGITVGSNSGGAIVNFSGSTKSISSGSSTGVNLTSNTGATINFTNGGLAITTTSGTGFSATGGGTVTVQGTGNSINSSAATALNVNATTIGGSGLTFQSISSSGTSKGISLNTTGSGGLTVTGTSTTDGTGGTIQNITTRGAEFISAQNITLKNMNFTNACTADFPAAPTGHSLGNNTADNAAIHLQDATTVVLDNLNITTSAEQGINGHNVNGFTLSNSVLSGLGGGPDEDGLHFYNMVGTCAITNTSITSSGDDNVNIQNNTTPIAPPTSTGTIDITGSSFNTGVLGSGILFGIRGTSNTTINISGTTVNNNFSGGVVADCFDTATMDVEVSTTTITNNNDAIQVSGHNGNVKFDIHDNSNISLQDLVSITILKSAFSSAGTLEGKIRSNTITTENGHTADGITVFNAGGATLKLAITNNVMSYAGTQRAILVQAGQDGSGSTEATITGNNIDVLLDGAGNAVAGILAQSAITGPGNTSALCIDIGGAGALSNTFTHSLGGSMAAGDIRVRQRNDGTVRLPGYVDGATDTAAVIAYLNGRNVEVSPSTATAQTTGFAGGGACSQPSF